MAQTHQSEQIAQNKGQHNTKRPRILTKQANTTQQNTKQVAKMNIFETSKQNQNKKDFRQLANRKHITQQLFTINITII